MEDTEETYQTIKIWTKTLKKLKLVAALSETSMVAVLDKLVSAELERLKAKEHRIAAGEVEQS